MAATGGDRRTSAPGPDTATPVDPVSVPGEVDVAVLPGRPDVDPLAGAVIIRADRPPTGLDGLLGTSISVAVPAVDEPLRSDTVASRYRRILRDLSV